MDNMNPAGVQALVAIRSMGWNIQSPLCVGNRSAGPDSSKMLQSLCGFFQAEVRGLDSEA